jgi:hypothetical protein
MGVEGDMTTSGAGTEEAISYIRSAKAIRERCGQILSLAEKDALAHFALHEERLPSLVSAVQEELQANYPDGRVPFHSRWRHFGVGGVDREAILNSRLAALPALERARAKLELAFVSVLLDAGAGDTWTFRDGDCRRSFGRSEGLAVASLEAFTQGAFGSQPYTVTADALCGMSPEKAARIFQVTENNPLAGLEGRVALLNQLGEVIGKRAEVFAGSPGRLGGMLESVASLTDRNGTVHADKLLRLLLDTFSPIWPGRISIGGQILGDVWSHSLVAGQGETDKLVPFHKLSQWLAYSLLEPLDQAGVSVGYLDELTGLPEYRNGGLLIDSGVLAVKEPAALTERHSPASELVVEWRALTVSLLDRIADGLRQRLDLTAEELPLAKVLQGGTWSLGRKFAAERRAHAAPPIAIVSDGTVF